MWTHIVCCNQSFSVGCFDSRSMLMHGSPCVLYIRLTSYFLVPLRLTTLALSALLAPLAASWRPSHLHVESHNLNSIYRPFKSESKISPTSFAQIWMQPIYQLYRYYLASCTPRSPADLHRVIKVQLEPPHTVSPTTVAESFKVVAYLTITGPSIPVWCDQKCALLDL